MEIACGRLTQHASDGNWDSRFAVKSQEAPSSYPPLAPPREVDNVSERGV